MEDAATLAPAANRMERGSMDSPLTVETLCNVYAARVFKFAQLVSRDSAAAEDLAQDALERAIRGLPTFDPSKGQVEGWLWRIVVNAGRDAGRVARRQRRLFELLVDRWPLDDRTQDVMDAIPSDRLLQAVRALSARYRAVVALRYGADLSYRDVGRSLGISENAALMTTRRALGILRRSLTHEVGIK